MAPSSMALSRLPSRADATLWRGEYRWRPAVRQGALPSLHLLRQATVSNELFPLGITPSYLSPACRRALGPSSEHVLQIRTQRVPSYNASYRLTWFLLRGCKFSGAGPWQSQPSLRYFFQ
jgi:hypothetical protein